MKDSRELEKWPILQTIPTLTGPKKIVKKRITVCQMSIFSPKTPKIKINEKLEKWLNLNFSAKIDNFSCKNYQIFEFSRVN